jgi:hypothetical protein
MAHSISLGKVTVAAAGTLVKLSTIIAALGLSDDALPNGRCHRVKISPFLGNAGGVYVGLDSASRQGPAFSSSTGVGVLRELQKPSAGGLQDAFEANGAPGENSIRPADYLVDVSSSGDAAWCELEVA